MTVEPAFIAVFVTALAGLGLSVAIERLMRPCPPLARPWSAWALHGGLWLLPHGVLILLFGRPWFATAVVSAFLLMLVLVNNAKEKALRETFVFQDYEYFTDMIRHPRLYIPFMGWWKFLGAAIGFVVAVCVGILGEPVPVQRFSWVGQFGAIVVVSGLALSLLLAGSRKRLPVTFKPQNDLQTLGLLASLWRYGQEERHHPVVVSPFDLTTLKEVESTLPQLVAVQSESFFDPRSMFSGIRPEVLKELDQLKIDAAAHGKLFVPAWGANTVRSEFAFLSGIGADKLGVHRFNPYRAIAAGWEVQSLASYLKTLGYRTICIHPYPANFYRRDRVYPCFGFDEFLDIRSFDATKRSGPYISDLAVAGKVAAILHEATCPVFVFVITMENHGPLHLERVTSADIDELYSIKPPRGCEDLTVYLRHLRNADRMIADLRSTLKQCDKSASLCWYGDHVPIMPDVYTHFGVPRGEVDYCIWNNRKVNPLEVQDVTAHKLPFEWLRLSGIIRDI